jgi:DNA-binding MarR family transcriptional regulator
MTPQGQWTRRRRVGPSGHAALQLLACCPRIPTDVVSILLGMRHARSAAHLLAGLRATRLARYATVRPGPVVGLRSVRLWTLTPAGQALVTVPGLALSTEQQANLPYGWPERWCEQARWRDLPLLIVSYRVLSSMVSGLNQPMRIAAWEHPWVRRYHLTYGRTRQVRLAAAAVLVPAAGPDSPPLKLLLLPDAGTVPIASYRPALRGLVELRRAEDDANGTAEEPLLVVAAADPAGSGTRMDAWRVLLHRVARDMGERPLRAQVILCGGGLVGHQVKRSGVVGQVDEIFALLARHPLLTRQQLAALLGTSTARIVRLLAQLTGDGWISPIPSADLMLGCSERSLDQLRRLGLVELTPAGRREAARRLLLAGPAAGRHHGVVRRAGSRGVMLRHLAHTLGTNAVFVAFVAAARRVTKRGGADGLEEWRSAAACARERFRPDGYGCYRRDGSRYGFFLEFDRGTERPSEHAAKLAAYYRYRDSGQSRRDYDGFPSLLVVTTSDAAEERFAYQAYLAGQRHAGAPILVFLTTERRIQAHPHGILGSIWCTPGPYPSTSGRPRCTWLPVLGSRGPGPPLPATASASPCQKSWSSMTRRRGHMPRGVGATSTNRARFEVAARSADTPAEALYAGGKHDPAGGLR